MASAESEHYVLRTLASIPPSERLLVIADDEGGLVHDLRALGFEVQALSAADAECLESRDGRFSWATVILCRETLNRAERLLALIRPSIRSGGWVILCADDPPDLSEWLAPGSIARGGFDSIGFAVADEVTEHTSGCHLLVRRVDPGTPA